MEDQLYREAILERYSNPINQGMVKKPDLEATLVNPLCGDEVKLQIKLLQGKVQEARFSGNGCALSQVSASLVAEFVEGKNLQQVKRLAPDKLVELLGISPTPARAKCVFLSLDVLKQALFEK